MQNQKTRKKGRRRHKRGGRGRGGEEARGVQQNKTGKSPKCGLGTSALLSLFPLSVAFLYSHGEVMRASRPCTPPQTMNSLLERMSTHGRSLHVGRCSRCLILMGRGLMSTSSPRAFVEFLPT